MQQSALTHLLAFLGSLKLALAGMLLLLLLILYDLEVADLSPVWLAACLGLLFLNLLAAVAVRPQFRRQPGLLVFHLCLAAVAGLSALQVLTVLEARVELAENQAFSVADVEILKRGPWHTGRLDQVGFTQGPVRVEYRPDLRRGSTHSTIYIDSQEPRQPLVFGDNRSFNSDGYRFITTPNKGWSVTLNWIAEDGQRAAGNIHMPSYPAQEWDQRQQWRTLSGEDVSLYLDLSPVSAGRDWTLSSDSFNGALRLIRADGSEYVLVKGQAVLLTGGSLELVDVGLWMGYRIEYNRVLPWLFAAAALGVAALGWHFWANPPHFRPAAGITDVA